MEVRGTLKAVKLKILGPHGGELPGCKSTCFLVDDRLALDAGALTSMLDLNALAKVDDILLTHSHFDHVKDLPMMSDVMVGRRDTPVTIHSNTECNETLKSNIFNNVLWPDFTRIPTVKNPVFKLRSFKAGASFKVGPYKVKSVLVSHPVESCGDQLRDGKIPVITRIAVLAFRALVRNMREHVPRVVVPAAAPAIAPGRPVTPRGGVRPHRTRHNFQQLRLAGAIAAHQHPALAGAQIPIDRAQDPAAAALQVQLPQDDFQGGHWRGNRWC